MDRDEVLKALATAGVRFEALEEAFAGVEPDHTEKPSLWQLRDAMTSRLLFALRDYSVAAADLRRTALAKPPDERP